MNNSKEISRQEKEAFDVKKSHVKGMNRLQLVIGYTAVCFSLIILVVATYILINSNEFTSTVVKIAAGGLLADFLAISFWTYKMVFRNNHESLTPFSRN